MRYTIAITAVLAALSMSACEKTTAVAPPPQPVVVTVPGPAGPAGPQGATGTPAEKGATGATGMTGAEGAKGEQGGTIVIVPASPPQR